MQAISPRGWRSNTTILCWLRKTFEILATNRAADLREQRTLAWSQDNRLSPRYYALLKEMRSAQAVNILSSEGDEAKIRQIRAQLTDLEAEAGAESKISVQSSENFRPQISLTSIQQNLEEDDALLSFSTGEHRSWLWAVTRHGVLLRQLAPAAELEQLAERWTKSIREGRPSKVEGTELSRALIGQLPKSIMDKPSWLVVNGEKVLLGVPLSALPVSNSKARMTNLTRSTPLVASHSIRYLVSEFAAVRPRSQGASSAFLGIGDPVYNFADSRLLDTPADSQRLLINFVSATSRKRARSPRRRSTLPAKGIINGP